MDLIINFSIRKDFGSRLIPVYDLILQDVIVKDEEYLINEITAKLPEAMESLTKEIEG